MELIMNSIDDTVEIVDKAKPINNFSWFLNNLPVITYTNKCSCKTDFSLDHLFLYKTKQFGINIVSFLK